MPLTERYDCWSITDGSHKDPHTNTYDNRLEVTEANALAATYPNIARNANATGVITALEAAWGWKPTGTNWVYDPKAVSRAVEDGTPLGNSILHELESSVTSTKTATTNALAGRIKSMDLVKSLVWPDKPMNFVCRFTNAQDCIGGFASSSYHLGNGLMGTAGHCLHEHLVDNKLANLRVVFGWTDNVAGKTFSQSEIYEIERVILCDFPGKKPVPNTTEVLKFTKRWDIALFQLKSNPSGAFPPKSDLSTSPPPFGSSIYNIGAPSRTPLKVSVDAHVLRYQLNDSDLNPFSHGIDSYGSFSTDLDQFGGNSGGPVFDKTTGKIVGHTKSTAEEVQSGSIKARENWSNEYTKGTHNYTIIPRINTEMTDAGFRPEELLSPKNLRCFGDPDMATAVCEGDIGPNGVKFPGPGCEVVLNRHKWDAEEVVHMNLSSRVDRSALFLSPLDGSGAAGAVPTELKIIMSGSVAFQTPDLGTRLSIEASSPAAPVTWDVDLGVFTPVSGRPNTFAYTVKVQDPIMNSKIPPAFLGNPGGVRSWSSMKLTQNKSNEPDIIGFVLVWERPELAFPSDPTWPPKNPPVTGDKNLKWPRETFHYATTLGRSSGPSNGMSQKGVMPSPLKKAGPPGPQFIVEGQFDNIWTNPRQPLESMAHPLVEDLDPALA